MAFVTPQNTALLVVDMQEGERMGFPKPVWNRVTSSISWLLEASRKASLPVVHIYLGEQECNGDMVRYKRGGQVSVRSKSHRIVEECLPQDGEWGYPKTGSDAFAMDNFLAGHRTFAATENIIICGVLVTDCVKATAFGARRNCYNVFVPPETTARTNLNSEEQTQIMRQLSTKGVDVRSIDKVTAMLPA